MNFYQTLRLKHNLFKPKTNRRAYEILQRVPVSSDITGAELGVYRGGLSRFLLKQHPGMTLFMVDSWEGDGGSYIEPSGDLKVAIGQAGMNACFEQAKTQTDFASNRRNILRMMTDEAAPHISDQSLDFCFIDADHSYEGCRADIKNYLPKVKQGGWLCGHDYSHPKYPEFGVKRAVDEFVSASNLMLELGGNYTWFVKLDNDYMIQA